MSCDEEEGGEGGGRGWRVLVARGLVLFLVPGRFFGRHGGGRFRQSIMPQVKLQRVSICLYC